MKLINTFLIACASLLFSTALFARDITFHNIDKQHNVQVHYRVCHLYSYEAMQPYCEKNENTLIVPANKQVSLNVKPPKEQTKKWLSWGIVVDEINLVSKKGNNDLYSTFYPFPYRCYDINSPYYNGTLTFVPFSLTQQIFCLHKEMPLDAVFAKDK